MFHAPPPASVRAAFSVDGEPVREVTSRVWRVGDAVLKVVDDCRQLKWVSELVGDIEGVSGFRVPRPLLSASGDWVVDGWSAAEWVDGAEDPTRWSEVLAAGDAFHVWLRSAPRPDWLEAAGDSWRTADRVAWGEQGIAAPTPFAALIEGLIALRGPLRPVNQLVHGDLKGNVLFPPDDGDPWIIDLSLYWRPAGYAAAIVAVDCYEWEGVGEEVLDAVAAQPHGLQLLVRAALFRLVRASMEDWADPARRASAHERTLAALRSRS